MRGRVWIALLGLMLAGIVAMQVEVLKLGANIGRSIEKGTALQSRNELLQSYVASLADDQRIERLAAGMGMVMPPPTGVRFLTRHQNNFGRVASSIHAPDATSFQAALLASQAAAAAATTPSSPVTPVTPTAPVATSASSTPSTASMAPTTPVTPAPTTPTSPTATQTPAATQTAAATSAPITATATTPTQTYTSTAPPPVTPSTSSSGGAAAVGG